MNMKKLLLLFCACFLGLHLWCQERNWEIGWQVLNTQPTPAAVSFDGSPGPSLFNGLLVKHREAMYKLRLGFQYLDLSTGEELSFCCSGNGEKSYRGIEMTVGIEKSAFFGPLEYYALFDLGLGAGQYKGNGFSGFSSFFMEPFNLRYRSISAAPGIGLSLWLKKWLALNWEMRWPGAYYAKKGSSDPNFNNELPDEKGFLLQKRPESFFSIVCSF